MACNLFMEWMIGSFSLSVKFTIIMHDELCDLFIYWILFMYERNVCNLFIYEMSYCAEHNTDEGSSQSTHDHQHCKYMYTFVYCKYS